MASYNAENATKLSALKALAERMKASYATKAELSELNERVEGLVTAGGEPNKLEGVKVNGSALAIAEKMVDILISTGSTNGSIKVNNADVAVAGLMALAYKAQVSQTDLDAALAAVIEAKAEKTDLSALGAKVTTLIGSDASKSVRAISAEEVAKIVAGAPESYDTLKELADWLSEHETDAASMNSAIQGNKSEIAALKTLIGSIPEDSDAADIVGYIAEVIADLGIGNYATIEAMNAALAKKVDKVDGKGLSENDYTTADKNKLAGIAEGATKVEASATPGSIKINGKDTPVVSVATDEEVSAMLDEVFGSQA